MLKKIPIKLVMIGHIDKIVDISEIKKHKSNLFTIQETSRISDLPSPEKNDGYFDIYYSKEEVSKMLHSINYDGICIAIMNYRYDDDFYMHRVGQNKVCISISNLEQILNRKDITLENFMIKNIYEILSFYVVFKSNLEEDVYEFGHEDTRGCLFDFNGDKNDIIYNTEKVKICHECLSKINKKDIPNDFIETLNQELLTIDKPILKRLELFIKQYPFISIFITFIFSVSINLFSNLLWELLKPTQ